MKVSDQMDRFAECLNSNAKVRSIHDYQDWNMAVSGSYKRAPTAGVSEQTWFKMRYESIEFTAARLVQVSL